jgi:hypothetical protein
VTALPRLRRLTAQPYPGRRILRWTAFWVMVALAALVAPAFVSSPSSALAPALLAGVTLAARRAPVVILVLLGLCSGMFVTVVVVLGLPVYPMMHGLVLGLGIASIIELMGSRERPRVVFGVWAFAAFSVVSLLWVLDAASLEIGLAIWRQVYLFLLIAPIVAIAPMPAFRSDHIVKAWLLLGIGLGGYALLRWQIGPHPGEADFAERNGGNFTKFEGELRPLGGAGDAHGMAAVMVPFVPFAFAIMLGWPGVFWRLVATACFGATALSLVASEVRSGMAAAALGVGVVLIAMLTARAAGGRRLFAVYIGALLIVGTIAATVTFYEGSLSEQSKRFSAILTPERDQSFQARLDVWRAVWAEVDEHPLGFGLGKATPDFAGFERFESVGTDNVVSSYLRVAYEQGFVYGVLFIAALLLVMMGFLREATLAVTPLSALCSVAAAGALAGWGVMLNFESPYIGIGAAAGAWVVVGLGLRQIAWRGREPGLPPPAAE